MGMINWRTALSRVLENWQNSLEYYKKNLRQREFQLKECSGLSEYLIAVIKFKKSVSVTEATVNFSTKLFL